MLLLLQLLVTMTPLVLLDHQVACTHVMQVLSSEFSEEVYKGRADECDDLCVRFRQKDTQAAMVDALSAMGTVSL